MAKTSDASSTAEHFELRAHTPSPGLPASEPFQRHDIDTRRPVDDPPGADTDLLNDLARQAGPTQSRGATFQSAVDWRTNRPRWRGRSAVRSRW